MQGCVTSVLANRKFPSNSRNARIILSYRSIGRRLPPLCPLLHDFSIRILRKLFITNTSVSSFGNFHIFVVINILSTQMLVLKLLSETELTRVINMWNSLPYGICVTFHPTQLSAPRLNCSHAGRYSIYLLLRDGRLSLPCYSETQPPGVEHVTSRSRIQRLDH